MLLSKDIQYLSNISHMKIEHLPSLNAAELSAGHRKCDDFTT